MLKNLQARISRINQHIQKGLWCENGNTLKITQILEMLIARNDVIGMGFNGTFQYLVIVWVGSYPVYGYLVRGYSRYCNDLLYLLFRQLHGPSFLFY